MRNHTHEIFALVISQTDVFPVGFAGSCKVKGEDGEAEGEKVGELGEDFDPRTGVPVHVDDDGDAVGGAFDWFPVRALEVEAAFGFECEICACEALAAE